MQRAHYYRLGLVGLCCLALVSPAIAQLPPKPNWSRTPPTQQRAVRPAQYQVEQEATSSRRQNGQSIMRTAQAPAAMPAQSRPQPGQLPQEALPADVQAQRVPVQTQQAGDDRFVQVSFRLRNIQPAALETYIIQSGARAEDDPQTNPERFSAFRYKTGAGASVGIRVDRGTGMVELEGLDSSVRVWRNLIAMLDVPPVSGALTQVVPVKKTSPDMVKQAMTLVRLVSQAQGNMQPDPNAPAEEDPNAQPMPMETPEEEFGRLLNRVQITVVEGGDSLIIKGRKADVERVLQLIDQIEKSVTDTAPDVDVVPLRHVNNEPLATLLLQIYDQVFTVRQGRATIIPLGRPNAILLIGRKENLDAVKELIIKLDQPTIPNSTLKVFPLKNIQAAQAEETVRNFFVARPGGATGGGTTTDRPGLGTRVLVISNARSNSLIVQAAPRDMQEVELLLKTLDADTNAAKHEVRVFRLKNALSQDLAPLLQQAISGGGGGGAGAVPAIPGLNQGAPAGGNAANRPSASLQFLQIDGQQSRLIESGILSDMSVVADARGNSLIVTGPARGMALMEALISQLDGLPAAEAQIKVFTIVNGDATSLATLLQQLFGQQAAQGGGFGQGAFGGGGGLAFQTATGAGETSLVPLRFSVDARTNSIVVSGTPGDLRVVYQILLRLDEGDVRERITTVYRLQNAPALDVSTAINQWLQGRQQLNQLETQVTSPFEQIERQVIVVPEVVSNSLIVSATPKYFEEVRKIVTDLDRRPPMVVIQVCIAEVTLGNTDEFGVELGLQDALLFNRGIGTVGFPFVGQPLGNNSDATSLATKNNVAGQATGTFGLGRTDTTLGYGGLVLSASSESVSVLVRALQDSRRLQVISRPQVQTLDNQPAFVQVGARVPRISSTQIINNSQVNATVLENVGILLGVTPRTSPDGLIVMEINAEKSQLGPIDQGIPISINANGDVIRSPQINITTAQTTVSARSGQTVILGGLITTSDNEISRRVPYLADVPVVGRLFRFDSVTKQRTELLIIMTPFIMRSDEDIEWMNQRESERMSWCLADIVNVHGEVTFAGQGGARNYGTSPLIMPDSQGYSAPKEVLPAGEKPRTDPDFLPGGSNMSPPIKAPLPAPAQPVPTQPLLVPPVNPNAPLPQNPLNPLPPVPPANLPPSNVPLPPANSPNPLPQNPPPGTSFQQPPFNPAINPATIVPVTPPAELNPAASYVPNQRVAPVGYFVPLEQPPQSQPPQAPQQQFGPPSAPYMPPGQPQWPSGRAGPAPTLKPKYEPTEEARNGFKWWPWSKG